MLKNRSNQLLFLLAIALVLRLYGITHGFPFIYNVDEPALVRSSMGIRFNLNPDHFDWPHFHFYLNFGLYAILYVVRGAFQVTGLMPIVSAAVPILWRDPLVFYLVSRIFNAVLGTLTLIPIYLTGRTLFGHWVGLAAAFALAVFPHHVWASHFALIDVPMVFWFSLSLLFSARILVMGGKRQDYMLAGLFSGLSASTKYNGAFGIAVLILAHGLLLMRNEGVKSLFTFNHLKNHKKLIFGALLFIVGFFSGTPFALLDFETFSRSDSPKGALWQFTNVGKVSFDEYIPQLLEVLSFRFIDDLGVTYLIIFELFFIFLLVRKDLSSKLFIFLPGLIYFLYVTSFSKNRLHYYMLTYPFLSLMVGYFGLNLYAKIRSKGLSKRVSVFVTSLLLFSLPLYYSLERVSVLAASDTRNLAYEWLLVNVKRDEGVNFLGDDLDPLLEKFEFRHKKLDSGYGLRSKDDFDAKYLVIATNEDLSDIEGLVGILDSYSEIRFFDSAGRNGPKVYIYETATQE